jgi:hypothetical protein
VGVQTRSHEEREERAKGEGAADTAFSASAGDEGGAGVWTRAFVWTSGRSCSLSLSTAQLDSEHFSDRINEPHVAQ